MTQVKQNKPTRLPHKMREELHEKTGFSKEYISRIIQQSKTGHQIWKAYEALLKERIRTKQESIAAVEQLRSKLVA